MLEIKMTDAHYAEGQKYNVGEKVVFKTGKAEKEHISLTPIKEGRAVVEFHTTEEFMVSPEPYTYYCVVAEITKDRKMKTVRLARRVTHLHDGTGEHTEFPEDEPPFAIFTPNILPWPDTHKQSGRDDGKIFYETYVINSYNVPFTPLLGTACHWEYTSKDLQTGFGVHDGKKKSE